MKHHCTTETRVKWRIYKPTSLPIHHKNWYYKLQNDIGVGTRGGHQGHVPPQVFINCYINCSPQSKSLSYATEWMCNEIPLSTCYIEKYHSFIVFDIATWEGVGEQQLFPRGLQMFRDPMRLQLCYLSGYLHAVYLFFPFHWIVCTQWVNAWVE